MIEQCDRIEKQEIKVPTNKRDISVIVCEIIVLTALMLTIAFVINIIS